MTAYVPIFLHMKTPADVGGGGDRAGRRTMTASKWDIVMVG